MVAGLSGKMLLDIVYVLIKLRRQNGFRYQPYACIIMYIFDNNVCPCTREKRKKRTQMGQLAVIDFYCKKDLEFIG